MTFGLACCAIEMIASVSSRYDIDRFGAGVFGLARQSDLMIVARHGIPEDGPRHSSHLRPDGRTALRHFHGILRTSGNHYNSYAVVQGVDQIVPVDVCILPAALPRPEALIDGLLKLQQKFSAKDFRK